eukprot:3021881-Pleurochrysis_carterae.AAC.1
MSPRASRSLIRSHPRNRLFIQTLLMRLSFRVHSRAYLLLPPPTYLPTYLLLPPPTYLPTSAFLSVLPYRTFAA